MSFLSNLIVAGLGFVAIWLVAKIANRAEKKAMGGEWQ